MRVVWIAAQDDVKRAFSKVKDDILNLKRSVNRELLAIDEMGSRLQTALSKEEFYSFIKRLGERLDKIEANLELYAGYDNEIKEVEARISNVGKKLSRQEDLSSEIKDVRKLKSKLSEFESSTVKTSDFTSENTKLLNNISSLKKLMTSNKVLEAVRSDMTEIGSRIETLEKSASTKEELAKNASSLSDLRKVVAKSESETNQKLDEISSNSKKSMEDLKEGYINKTLFDEKFTKLKKDLDALKRVMENSVSEVDLADYATQKAIDKKLDSGLSDLRERLQLLEKHSASSDDIEKIDANIKDFSNSIDAIKAGIEKVAQVTQEQFTQGLTKTDAKFEKELSKLKSDFEEKLKKSKNKPVDKQGFLPQLGKGIADFFKEEEEPPKKEEKKRAFNVSEFIKDEEKKTTKETSFGSLFIIGAIVLLLVLGGIFYFVSTRSLDSIPSEELDEVTAEEIREESEGVDEELVEEEVLEEPIDTEVSDELEEEVIDTEEPPPDEFLEKCKETYECKERVAGEYWFDCHIDTGECRCFVTNAEGCGIVAQPIDEEDDEADDEGGLSNISYLIVAGAILTIMLFVYMLATAKEEKEENGPEEESVDLDEFFDKKEPKK